MRWNGQPVEDLAAFFLPPRSAYTSQVPLLFSESIKDNILMGLPEDKVDLQGQLRWPSWTGISASSNTDWTR